MEISLTRMGPHDSKLTEAIQLEQAAAYLLISQ